LKATVYERFDTRRCGKGAALNWMMTHVLNNGTTSDAYVFVDGDSTVSPNILEEMNRMLEGGHRVIQASYVVKDLPRTGCGRIATIAFSLFNYVRPLGRSALGVSAGLRGNGMCFDSSLTSRIRWNEDCLVEDLELGNRLLLEGITVAFAPAAVVSSALPTTRTGLHSQRMRWERGRFRSDFAQLPALLKSAILSGRLSVMEAALDLMLPPLVLFAGVAAAFLAFNAVLAGLGIGGHLLFMFLWGSIIVAVLLHAVIGSIIAKLHPRELMAFIYLPEYVAWKAGLYWAILRRRTPLPWIRTAR
jgi:cellulose synthase/poly-beta-1,6-N-acetylglucosamine synthase-like glycosyltransferase